MMIDKEIIAVIAGGGALPLEVYHRLKTKGAFVFLVAIKGEASRQALANADIKFNWGQIGSILKRLKEKNIQKLLLIGKIDKRPDFRSGLSMLFDNETRKYLPKIRNLLHKGDNHLLGNVVHFLEEEGFELLSIKNSLPELLAKEMVYSERQPDAGHLSDADLGFSCLAQLSPFDIGQSMVVGDGRIVAVEAAEGTDAMLKRVAQLRAANRIEKRASYILVKTEKHGQDERADLPVIGVDTIKRAAKSGISAIFIEAGKVIVTQPEEIQKCANKHKMIVAALQDRAEIIQEGE